MVNNVLQLTPEWRENVSCASQIAYCGLTGYLLSVEIAWKILATLGLVAVNGFFVMAEFAAVGVRASRLEADAEEAVLARAALQIKQRLELYLSSCQLGVTLASLGLGAVTEPLVAAILAPVLAAFRVPGHDVFAIAFTFALAISTSLHIVIGEQAPKNWAIRYSDRILPLVAVPLVAFTYVFFPVIWLLNSVTQSILRLTGVNTRGKLQSHGGLPYTEEELRALLAQAVAAGTISKGHGSILSSAFDFGQLMVRQIMVPRTSVDYLSLDEPIGDMLRTVQRSALHAPAACGWRSRSRHWADPHEGPVCPPPARTRQASVHR